MNNLANLTQMLKLKPRVTKEEDIEVVIIPEQPQQASKKELKGIKESRPTNVVVEKDNGSTALELLKRLEKQQMTKVAKKEPAAEAKEG